MPATADAAMYTIGCSFFVGLTTFVSTQMTAASSSPFQKNRSANRPLARKVLSCRSEMRTTATPAAVGDAFNVATSAFVDVPRGCCAALSVRNVSAQAIDVANANLMIERVA